jgi:hypothetical protein
LHLGGGVTHRASRGRGAIEGLPQIRQSLATVDDLP